MHADSFESLLHISQSEILLHNGKTLNLFMQLLDRMISFHVVNSYKGLELSYSNHIFWEEVIIGVLGTFCSSFSS